MSNRTGISRLRQLVAGTVLASYLTACTSWQVQRLSPQQVLTTEQPTAMEVMRSDSTRVVLTQPEVSGDSLVGLTKDGRLSIPLTDIASVALRKWAPVKTVGMMLGVAALAVVTLGVLVAIQCSGNSKCFD
jgi:hypothetical protein